MKERFLAPAAGGTLVFTRLFISGVATLLLVVGLLGWLPRVYAVEGQAGAPQVTLNPGGGVLANGSDGLRFTINSDQNHNWSSYDMAYITGQDGVVYRGTYQYCCSAGAPMLNIGGTLYGQAGPAYDGSQPTWSSIEVVSTAGATATGARTAATGNSSATIRYTAEHNDLSYVVTRTVTYVYPNDFVTDSYSFTIPQGNNDEVKFYLGGDTAPGSSDSGYGIMLTEPVRSVISLNTSSEIMFGFREVSGSKPFDGATSQSYYTPFPTVQTGGDIGFVGSNFNHDAGLMMQWNLGSTPGTQTASLQQFATQQGTNLNAAFATNTTDINDPVALNISIVNTELTEIDELGYTLTLPAGLVVGAGSQSNTCDGTVTAGAGTNAIILDAGAVGSGSNCIVSVPVVASSAGTYTILAASFSGLEGALTNNVGTSSLTVSNLELGSDLNGDGAEDAGQPNVYSYTNPVDTKLVVLEVDDACSVSAATSAAESANTSQDSEYTYVNGLMNFTLACGTPGYTTEIKQYYYNVPSAGLVLRKYNPNSNTYTTIEGAVIEQTIINGAMVTVVTYEVTDGGELDADGAADGSITDPAGLGQLAAATGGTGLGQTALTNLASTGASTGLFTVLASIIITASTLFLVKTSRVRP